MDELPFLAACRAHADDAHTFGAERDEHHNHNAIRETPHGDQPVVPGRNDHGSLEEPFIQIGEVEPIVFGDVGEALRFIPNDLHKIILYLRFNPMSTARANSAAYDLPR